MHPTKDKNSVLDSLIAKIKIYKEEKSNEENEKDIIISIKEDEFQKKQHELKNINIIFSPSHDKRKTFEGSTTYFLST